MSAATVLLVILGPAGLAVGAVVGLVLSRTARRNERAAAERAQTADAERVRAEAAREREALLRDAEIAAREEGVALRAAAEQELRERRKAIGGHEATLAAREARIAGEARSLADLRATLGGREEGLAARERERELVIQQTRESGAHFIAALEAGARESAEALRRGLVDVEVEATNAQAAQALRVLVDSAADPEHGRRAKRIMGIAVGRFHGHYLTERQLSLIPLEPRARRTPIVEPELRAIESVAGITLSFTEAGDAVRIEGLDGVGREVARRALAKLLRRPASGPEGVARITREIVHQLDREIVELGRRAFSALEIPRAHPEIVKLVGRLNFRTSYTQNQWKHAIEAGFLCGMMADELGLDRKMARRAALMHDIGKALTHELDGSHAVIGADYARRLGEAELVANAIGAHHTDEPFASPYAYLVAAADAMSGARPGARRQTEDNHVAKLAELERLSRSFRGVGEAFAVQGGREVRVYVQEDRIDDLGAVRLSSELAETISREMTFPGQIKVTVIREFKAVETAN